MHRVTHPGFNYRGVLAIYLYELARFKRTIWQSLVTPVITTSLYFVVFGAAIGTRMSQAEGVSYGAFIVPGLMLLAVVTESLTTSAFSIYMPKFVGTIYEILSAPLSALEVVVAYVGATASKAILLAIVILATSTLFVPLQILHPLWTIAFMVLTAATFSLFGFIIGILARNFEQLSFVPLEILRIEARLLQPVPKDRIELFQMIAIFGQFVLHFLARADIQHHAVDEAWSALRIRQVHGVIAKPHRGTIF